MKYFSVVTLMLLISAVAAGGEPDRIDFDTQIIPILTRAGCNAGACHGAAAGRGEFHLSLYGGDPAFDFESIALELEGRRVNLAHPENSLLLLKATESINHGGGPRLEYDGAGMKIIQQWIAENARRRKTRHLLEFEVEPNRQITGLGQPPIPLKATAAFSDGSSHDVTQWTVFTAEDPASVRIDNERNSAEVLRTGRHIVIARYLDRVVPLVLLAPQKTAGFEIANTGGLYPIDAHVDSLLETLQIPVSPQADDLTFLRRVTLDFTGRLPTLEQLAAFEKDSRADKRERLIDSLLESDAYVDYWTYKFAKLLRIRASPQDRTGAKTYHDWLRTQIAQDAPYNQVARTLVTAMGDSHRYGPANFYRTAGGPREQAEFVSELFLGSRLRCANCHNHPFDRWTQDDYHGLAAVFAKMKSGRVIEVVDSGSVIHPRTGETAVPRIPGETFLSTAGDSRAVFADWLTDAENPYFARAIVNRLWKELMGRGLVEPTDDLRSTNPATHPELLTELADDFVAHNYSVKHTLHFIASSTAYARSATVIPGNQQDDRYFSHAIVRSLEPEVLADALAEITGVPMKYGDEPLGTRAVTLFDANISSPELEILGRCSREESCEGAGDSVPGLPRMLHQLTGPLINARIKDSKGRLAKQIEETNDPERIIEEFYRRALSRSPSEQESRFWQTELSTAETSKQQREILQDFVWALCTCREFTTNH